MHDYKGAHRTDTPHGERRSFLELLGRPATPGYTGRRRRAVQA